MNWILKILSVLIILCTANVAFAKGYPEIDAALEKLIGEKGGQVPGLAVIAIKDGKEVYSKFLGRRHIRPNKPITRDTKFRIASISKIFTMLGVMQLVDEGKVDLDEDASKYLGFELRNPNFPDEPITVRMLASHTSTLRDYEETYYAMPMNVNIKEFFDPGSRYYENGSHFAKKDKTYFEYCNINYNILGTILEKVTGQRFDDYMEEKVLRPLDISGSFLVSKLSKKDFANLATLYRKKREGVWNENYRWAPTVDDYKKQPTDKQEDYVIGTNAAAFSAAAGLRISCPELTHLLKMVMDGGVYNGRRIISEKSLKEMLTPQWTFDKENPNGDPMGVIYKYGLGFYMIDGDGKGRLCQYYEVDLAGHGGDAYGLIGGFYILPGTKDGFVFVTTGQAVQADQDPRSLGKFSNSYIWEEEVANPILTYIYARR